MIKEHRPYLERLHISNVETLNVASTRVEKDTVSINGENSTVTTVFTSKSTNFDLIFDHALVSYGIALEENGLLINQNKTAIELGRKAGIKPEFALENTNMDTVVVPGNHFGWQSGAFLIKDGNLVLIRNDQEKLSGEFDILAYSDFWQKTHISILNGNIKDNSQIEGIKIGFSTPIILDNNEMVDIRNILSDPRLLADSRNVVDFGNGKILDAELAALIRKVIPSNKPAIDRLVRGDKIIQPVNSFVSDQDFLNLQRLISKNNLSEYLYLDIHKGKRCFAVLRPLPLQKMPFMGYGYSDDGSLIISAIDGRQEKSAGVTIENLARIMKEKGAITAGLMTGGADVAVVTSVKGTNTILNSPSTIDSATNKRVSRSVPSLLTIY